MKPAITPPTKPQSTAHSLMSGRSSPSPDIFRDISMSGEGDEETHIVSPVPPVRCTNPFRENRNDVDQLPVLVRDESACQGVISPYPYSYASREEIEERALLNITLAWPISDSSDEQDSKQRSSMPVDYSHYFGLVAQNDDNQVVMDCDDFSMTSDDSLLPRTPQQTLQQTPQQSQEPTTPNSMSGVTVFEMPDFPRQVSTDLPAQTLIK